MQIVGIVAEYNPFHTGHAYQIARSRRALGDAAVVAVMSGCWVQQGGCAIADKWLRARLALMGGADLVLELPTVWATASAESFARGAVSLLDACGVVDALSFGSECGEVEPLQEVAACLDGEPYRAQLARLLDGGMAFAAARQGAVQEVLGCQAQLLSTPNNNLGVEYLRALNALDSSITPMTVRRQGAAHNSLSDPARPPRFLSATQLRRQAMAGLWGEMEPHLVPGGRALLQSCPAGLPDLARVERAMLARVRRLGL